jgi:transcriptional regulator with XRE-family HTH domain
MDKGNTERLGRFIHDRRREQGLALREVAERAGVSKSFLSAVENADAPLPSLSMLRRIARGLEVDEADLLAAAGHLPDVGPYLRARFDLPEPSVEQVEDFVRFVRGREQAKGGRDEQPTDTEQAA